MRKITRGMRVLISNHNYVPELASTGRLAHDLAWYWVEHGLHVTVITGQTGYVVGDQRHARRENIDGVNVIRVWNPRLPKRSALLRSLRFVLFGIVSAMRMMLTPCDVIVVMSQPPVLNGFIGRIVATLRRVPYAYVIWDLNPEQAQVSGFLGSARLVRILKSIDSSTISHARSVVVPSQDILDFIKTYRGVNINHGGSIIPWLPRDAGKTVNVVQSKEIRRELIGDAEYLIMYSGNLGLYYGLERLVSVAEILQKRIHIRIAIVGDGVLRDVLYEKVRRSRLSNVVFHDYFSNEMVLSSLAAADCHWVPFPRRIVGISSPSKLAPIMSVGRPIVTESPESQIGQIVLNANCGVVVKEPSPLGLEAGIRTLFFDKNFKQLGENGKLFYEQHLTAQMSMQRMSNMLLGHHAIRGGDEFAPNHIVG